jgi:phytanoyl-CoA hydroxylase
VKTRYRMTADGSEAYMETLDPTPYTTDDLVPIEAEAGTLVLLHGTLPHWSAPNVSDRSRHAYTLHIIDGVADYPDDNWLRRDATLPMRGFV